MITRLLTVLVTCLIGAQSAFGGEPTDVTEKCPFGNESVTYVSTLGCSSYGEERLMSLAPVTSCDFIERMPQCKKSKLPLYREFSKAEVKELRAFSKTDEYSNAATQSRFYLAFVIEKHLLPSNTQKQLDLLVGGLWFDPEHTYSSDPYFLAFSNTMNSYTPTAPQEQKDFLRAVGAFGLIQRGNVPKAKEIMAAIRKSPRFKDSFLPTYLKLLDACMNTPTAEKCRPDYTISLSP